MFNLFRSLSILLFVAPLFAQPTIEVDGTIDQTLPSQPEKTIQLIRLKLSSEAESLIAKKMFQAKLANTNKLVLTSTGTTPSVQLAMNNVPVLDQGPHGTCVTFSATAALDAIIGQGDYISQLCTLTLNQYLSSHGYAPDFWNGTLPKHVFNQMNIFGIVNKANEHQYGCGGLNAYPNLPSTKSNEMDVDQFHQISQNLFDLVDFDTTQILDYYQFVQKETPVGKVEQDVKNCLNQGDRLTIGTIVIPDNFIGAYGKYHASHDTWILNSDVVSYINSNQELAGHAMVLTGYDDNAVVMDSQGNSHRGLFTLRNSWGPRAGDQGNFYMSYDYFRSLVMDLMRIRKLS